MEFDKRGSHDKMTFSCKERSKCHENPTGILPNKADSVHLRDQRLSHMSEPVAGSLYEWSQNGTKYGRGVDDRTQAAILPEPGLPQVPRALQVGAMGSERPSPLHLWLRRDCPNWLVAADELPAI